MSDGPITLASQQVTTSNSAATAIADVGTVNCSATAAVAFTSTVDGTTVIFFNSGTKDVFLGDSNWITS
jgi:hypothetical protein